MDSSQRVLAGVGPQREGMDSSQQRLAGVGGGNASNERDHAGVLTFIWLSDQRGVVGVGHRCSLPINDS